MNLHLALFLVTLATAAAIFLLGWQARVCVTERRVDRLADPDPMPGELPPLSRAGYFDLPGVLAASYGPFPADTGPLLLLGEKASANEALAREVRWMIAEAERRIGPVQRE